MKKRFRPFLLLLLPLFPGVSGAQGLLTGKVTTEVSGEGVAFANVAVLELKLKARTDEQGNYSINVPPGEYTFIVTAEGLLPLQQKLRITGGVQNFRLRTVTVRGAEVILRDQKRPGISRNTLTREQIKSVPATLGDSLGALSALPGVIRSGGFFGPLIIRGAPESANRYFIDGIPALYPQHFGALQAIISNDLIDEINLFSSAYPVEFSQATGAVIDINTVDEIRKRMIVLDISLLSASFYMQSPINRLDAPVEAALGEMEEQKQQRKKEEEKASDYWIAAARFGYLSVVIPPIIRVLTGEKNISLPEYYDYQLKGKWYSESRRHALTVLLFGSYDTWKFVREPLTAEEQAERDREGRDPLLDEFDIRNVLYSNSQGLTWTYRPIRSIKNRLLTYNTVHDSYFFVDPVTASRQGIDRTIDIRVKPNESGLKDDFSLRWGGDLGKLDLGSNYRFFWYEASGKTQQLLQPNLAQGNPDFADNSLYRSVPVDFRNQNHLIGGYLQNTFYLGWFEITPGARADYLQRTKGGVVDPRGLALVRFPTETTVSVAGGIYHSWAQVNSFRFNQFFNQQPQIAESGVAPEKAHHYSAAVEQTYDLFTLKIEGFYNEFFDLVVNNSASTGDLFVNSDRGLNHGVEVLLRKDRLEERNGLFGWWSYTWTRARSFPGDTRGSFIQDKEYPSQFDQTHSVKLIMGYVFGVHTISSRFELASGFPYTAIVSSTGPSNGRYAPVYGEPYGGRLPYTHRLDLRYSQRVVSKRDIVNWYIEIINVYNYSPENRQRWRFNRPYEAGVNPNFEKSNGLALLPNFGVEIKF